MCCGMMARCQNPKKLKGKAVECSDRQMKECHGDAKKPPCTLGDEKNQKGACD
jgi:hypothetical protein